MTTAAITKQPIYQELQDARDAAWEDFQAAVNRANGRARMIATWLARDEALPSGVLDEYRAMADEEEQLRVAFMDASDRVRDLTGRRRILR